MFKEQASIMIGNKDITEPSCVWWDNTEDEYVQDLKGSSYSKEEVEVGFDGFKIRHKYVTLKERYEIYQLEDLLSGQKRTEILCFIT